MFGPSGSVQCGRCRGLGRAVCDVPRRQCLAALLGYGSAGLGPLMELRSLVTRAQRPLAPGKVSASHLPACPAPPPFRRLPCCLRA